MSDDIVNQLNAALLAAPPGYRHDLARFVEARMDSVPATPAALDRLIADGRAYLGIAEAEARLARPVRAARR